MELKASLLKASIAVLTATFTAIFWRILYMQKFHPLSRFPGPWYATSFSVVGAIISVKQKEPEFFMYLVKRYGSDQPIRISPTMLLFPRPSALKDIYWDPQCNRKSGLYGTGALGPPHLFTTLEGDEHRALRKALSNAPWTIGQLKKTWESRFDDQINLFAEKMHEHAAEKRTICLSDKVAEFAADIMSMISFTEPFGSVRNQRDEKDLLRNWRNGLTFFGFVGRFRFFRERIIKLPRVGLWFLPAVSNESGMGWLMCEADRQVSTRESQNAERPFDGKPDFLQHCLDARFADGSTLTPMQKRAHVTLLIQAGADTTGTALGSILRFIVTHPSSLARARAEIESADQASLLSFPIKYEETRQHLPFFVACIKEGLRLNPPATNLFARVVPQGGKVIDGHFIPGGTEITSHSYSVQRNNAFYGEDAEKFVPERWLINEKRNFELEAAQFTFGVGPRVCLGKDIAMMEMYKLLPEIIRRFDIDPETPGRYVVDGGVAYNENFLGKLVTK
ncbi:cytochrome P450 [Cucurbitaria berberidis CBS 394.84]|uniref:Cytochrome P450 n=1 Tax=Cucurbitaria berberidis CBS 394.84 TaxID=1168544 RepID=A0A9P4GHJ7_9PLEO|nr:cytochrome P450 [Cucurbitaria berberidis CBS 394.84]KAF1845700.1 cytochrome P450 [Cucurbitaria berberidis CBS 394.84]